MRNELFHQFVPNFNFWYIAMPLFIVIIAIMAYRNVYVGFRKTKVYRNYNIQFFNMISAIFSAIVATMVYIESFAGIVQLFDNCLAVGESGVWSLWSAITAIPGVGIAFYLLLGIVSDFIQDTKEKKLAERYNLEVFRPVLTEEECESKLRKMEQSQNPAT